VSNNTRTRTLSRIAMLLGAISIVWLLYGYFDEQNPRTQAYLAAERAFEDQHYAEALAAFEALSEEFPQDVHALRGMARSLMQLGRLDEALAALDEAIAREPDVAASWANRGILNDRLGNYEAAIRDYEKSATLDETVNEGPSWLTRFLRNQQRPQATVLERAAYLREQLAKPESERLLRLPEADAEQRSYRP
jgi:tetratricopeptide (TPR) repeat protein